MISRLKIISNLDITERRMPQDGRFNLEIRGKKIDCRVSIMPVIKGEKAVIRILDREIIELEIDSASPPGKSLCKNQDNTTPPDIPAEKKKWDFFSKWTYRFWKK